MTKESIQITEAAFARVAQLAKTPMEFLRISVDGGGCSGFTYKYEMTSTSEPDDIVYLSKESKVVIDPMSIEYMKDSVVDFVLELGASYFSIKNPQATAKCGCGNSFSV